MPGLPSGGFCRRGDVYHVDRNIHQLGAERRARLFAAAFHEDQFKTGMAALEIGDRLPGSLTRLREKRRRQPGGVVQPRAGGCFDLRE